MTLYEKLNERLLPNGAFYVSEDDEEQTSQNVSLGISLLHKTPIKETFITISVKGSLCSYL